MMLSICVKDPHSQANGWTLSELNDAVTENLAAERRGKEAET